MQFLDCLVDSFCAYYQYQVLPMDLY